MHPQVRRVDKCLPNLLGGNSGKFEVEVSIERTDCLVRALKLSLLTLRSLKCLYVLCSRYLEVHELGGNVPSISTHVSISLSKELLCDAAAPAVR